MNGNLQRNLRVMAMASLLANAALAAVMLDALNAGGHRGASPAAADASMP